MRLFVAIPLPPKIRSYLADIKEDIPGINWTKPENLHITVQFFGEVEEEYVSHIIKNLHDAANYAKSFTLELDKIVFAPPKKKPRMIWGVFSGNEGYNELVDSVSASAAQVMSGLVDIKNKMPWEERIPHATLARFKDPKITDKFSLPEVNLDERSFVVRQFELWESKLTPEGREYISAEKFTI